MASLEQHPVYLDFNATTPISQRVKDRVWEAMEAWGNPSSVHWAARAPKALIREARQILAKSLGCQPLELIFTSGGSESNATVLKSIFEKIQLEKNPRCEFISTTVEHPSVMKTLMHLRSLGAVVHLVPVNRQGVLDVEFYKSVLSERTALVSVMYANNETGNVFPIQKLAKLAHAVGALFHTDAVQALGKVPIDLQRLDVDYASFSAHKFYSLKGTGVFFQKRGAPLTSLILGGGQERHRRGGTENVVGIHALRVMAEELANIEENFLKVRELRDHLESRILSELSDVTVTGAGAPRLPNTLSLVIPGVDGETLLMSLDLKGYAVSTGAACSSGNPEPSPVLLAMGLAREEAQSSLRLSLGWTTNKGEIDNFVDALKDVVHRLRQLETRSREVLHAVP